ncbi:MAG: ATP-dependent helicase [Clostridiales bacterium GWF2_38_85]|nr:MAG: ATP-dependent helicase [Clostridiales bacterium GWF2_38_85]HBL84234.1 ATP-dependent helicase [Clostridiales bacterium]
MTDNNVFNRLSPFIKNYIYRNNWTELREVQVEACKVIFDTDAHLLLSTGTASGKTEAAFLPVLTELTNDPPLSVGVLYVAPLKSLINDQFYRLNGLLEEANIPVWHWHGDVSQSHKKKLMREPQGVLQITPESLESMLINKNRDLVRIFGDLRFIIIDEVHSFMGTDRGIQVICQLERLQRFIRNSPRRIGLSATLGDYTKAEQWLASGTDRRIITPQINVSSQKIRLAVEHFYDPLDAPKDEKKEQPDSFESEKDADINLEEKEDEKGDGKELKTTAFWEYIYEKSLNKKCIIFANMRDQAEYAIAMLRQIAELRGSPDIYHVHHGSISSALREEAESEMKESAAPIVVGATLTLEMGIDIGQLERIIQIDAPSSVSSFLQRLGRSGRRGNASEMWFVCREEKPSGLPMLPLRMPWKLMQDIAIIQLYIEEHWIEQPRKPKYPLSMLYHQTMSVLAELGEATPALLAKRVLGMEAFKSISFDDYRELLQLLIQNDHLQLTSEGSMIIGLTGEKIVGSFKFFAVFPEEDDYTIVADSNVIGKVEFPPPPGERMTIAGRTWEVLEVDLKSKIVNVKRVKGKIKTYWAGGNLKIDNHILQRMRRILTEQNDFPYLQKGAKERMSEAYFLARSSGLDKYNVVSLGGKSVCIFPWMGNIDYYTIMLLIKKLCGHMLNLKSVGGQPPYFITLKIGSGTATADDFLAEFRTALNQQINLEYMLDDNDIIDLKGYYEYKPPKFDKFAPMSLLKKAIINDYIDLDRIRTAVGSWTSLNEGKAET